ncbi:DUF4350 domain-containing protein [Actinocorallia populi]|uniref:DUF4350 domain-containing protein n=1 Tax=Actinocorallia populi TaxID=2079200 RepID=UPI000D097E91|nr:DUF4350 domain-containing protein [Actinocorallia populi]
MTQTAAHAESAAQVAGRRVRRWRGIVLPVLALAVIAVLLAALRPEATGGYLDPESPGGNGSRALAEIVRQNGTPVTVARTARAAASEATRTTVVVVVRSERLTRAELRQLAAAPGTLLLVEPTDAALKRLAPGVSRATTAAAGFAVPGCPLMEGTGTVTFGDSQLYTAPSHALTCYPDPEENLARMVVLGEGAPKPVTVLGSGTPLTNDELAEDGNAAFGMDLLGGAHDKAVWLMPDLPTEAEAGDESLAELIPPGVTLFFWQVLIAVGLLALWRVRRLGPVVVERLPVAVRSAETVEGRARLYRAARARDRAALALRESARERFVPLLGLPRSAAADPGKAEQVTILVTSRTGWDRQTAGWALYGPAPGDDAELVRLTDLLDDLEKRLL